MNHNQYASYIESEKLTLKESFVYDREYDEDKVKPKKVSVRKTRKTDFLDFVSK